MTCARLLCLSLLASACASGTDSPASPVVDSWKEAYRGANWWLNVHARSDTERWVVGGTPTAGAIARYDGTAFVPVSLGATVPLLNWMTEDSAGSLFVVGNHGTALVGDKTGATWTVEQTGTEQDLWGVFPVGVGELIAVGGSGRDDGAATVLRRTKSGWAPETLPTLVRPGVKAFFKVWGSSAADLWVVGQSGAVVHFNGSAWEERHAGTDRDLIAVWGTAPDRVVMVGGRGNGVIVFWDGLTFRQVDVAPIAGLNGVWMRNRDVVHAVGLYGTTVTFDFDTGRSTETVLDTDHDLHAITGTADGRLTAVGGTLAYMNGPYEGSVFMRTLGAAE